MIKENKFRVLLRKMLSISPGFVHNAVSFLYLNYGLPLSLGPIRYLKFYNFLKESQWWPHWRLEDYQIEKLKQLLKYAYNNVPYYTEVFKKLNLTPEDIRSIRDLRKLPILSKEDIVKNFDKLVSKKINKNNLELVTTSGTTGKPIQFYREKQYGSLRLAFFRRRYDLIDIKTYDKWVHIWSRPFIEREIKDIYLYEPHMKKLSLSTFPHNLNLWDKYIKLIKQFRPILIFGNPSLLYHLACFAKDMNINDINFRYFLSTYENLFSYQRELIKKQFNCEVFNYYGCEERVISAFECPAHMGMHIEMERGIIEIVDDNEQSLPEEHLGRIIATGLYNYAMPFIRYDTGDAGSISKEACSCGRGSPLLKSFNGRANEVVKYKDKIIYSTTLSVLLWKFKNIKECQFIQDNENEIKINIVKRKDYSERDTQELIKTLKAVADEDLNIIINFVDYIPRTKMGKFSFVVNNIKNNQNRD